MKTILGNFARVAQDKGKFPMDANTLEKLQENTALLAVLGAALGKRAVILTGCEKNGNRRTEGYVYVKLTDTGEVLYFPGGDYTESFCHINAEDSDVTAKGEPYEDAYTTRTLENGRHPYDATQTLEWGEFVVGSEIYALRDEYEREIKSPAVVFVPGMVMMWSRPISEIPRGWHLCDGTHGTKDLRDLFIVGAGRKYEIEDFGGLDKVTLTTSQMPSHTHNLYKCSTEGKHWHVVYNDSGSHHTDYAKNAWCADSGSTFKSPTDDDNSAGSPQFGHTDKDGAHSHTIELYKTGGDTPHENRPPYFALAYIQYIGV